MSLMMPPGLNWIAQITVGEDFPQADEDRLREVARQLAQASARLERLSAQLGPVVSRVLESMSGSAVSEFTRFMRRLHTVVPGLADASGELGRSASETALQIEYAKLMIIMQMIITAIEVAHLLMLAPAAVPARVAATRLTVRQILRRLFLNILAGMAMELGLDAIAQTIQILRGDRTQWDTGLTTDALVGGAVGGAVEGLVAGAAGRFLPGLSRTTLGQAGIGGVSGLAETLVSNAVLGDDGELWMGAASGAFGRVISGPEVDTPDVKDLPDLGTLPLFKPETPDGIGETADGRVGTAPTDTATGPATTTTTLPVGVGVGVGAGSASASAVSRGGGSAPVRSGGSAPDGTAGTPRATVPARPATAGTTPVHDTPVAPTTPAMSVAPVAPVSSVAPAVPEAAEGVDASGPVLAQTTLAGTPAPAAHPGAAPVNTAPTSGGTPTPTGTGTTAHGTAGPAATAGSSTASGAAPAQTAPRPATASNGPVAGTSADATPPRTARLHAAPQTTSSPGASTSAAAGTASASTSASASASASATTSASVPAPADAPVSTAPGQLAKKFDITLYGPLHRAFHQYMLRQPDSSNFLYMYHGFGGEQTLFTSKLYGAAGTWTLLQRFHQKVLEIEESQKARATPIVRTGTEPMKVYRKMSPAEAGQITNHPGGHRSGLNRAMQHGSTPQYRKFFTTSLSHTAVFTNENATTGDDIVLEFTLPWQGYWDFVRRYGTPNQRPGAYDVVDSALLHQEQLRAGPDANFRTAAAVDAVIEHVTHHNIGIGHGNAQPFHAMVTQVRPVTRQEVDRAAAEADAARRSAVVRRVNELIDDDIARYAAEQNAAAASGSSLSAEPLPAAPAPRHDSAPPRGEPSGPTPAGPSAPVRVEAPAPDRAETLDSGRAETPDSGRAEAPAPFQAEVPASFQAGPSAPVPVETPAPVRPDRAPALVDSLLALSAKDLCDALAVLPAAHVRWLASHPPLVEGLRAALPPSGFASAAARLLTVVPDGVARPVSARDETYARLEGMLGDPDVAARLLLSGAEVVVLPQDAPLSGVSSFAGLHGDPGVTGGRSLDELRGATTARTAALPEENLLGERTPVGPAPHQAEGYSTATHELAHLIHLDGLTDADRRLIDRSFTEKRAKGADEEWPDGVRRDLTGRERDNYSATDPYEYFAQATNAYLGTNHGTDAATGRPRNNGPDWVRAHEPALTPLLRRLYGERPAGAPRRPANPVRATDADNARYEAFRDFWDGLSGPSDTPQDPPRTLTDDTLAPASVPTPARPHAVVAASPAVSADDLTTTAAPPADTATPPAVPIVTVTPPDDAPDTGGEPPVSGYVRAFGSGESPTPGLVAVEPPAPATVTVLRGLLIEHLGVRDDDAVAHADLDRRLAPEQLEEHLSALLAPDGHPVTVTVDGTPRTVAVRLSLTHAGPSPRFGEHGTGPEHRLERRASAAQSTTDTDGSATSRTLSTGWNGTFPLRAENKNLSLFALRGAVQLSLTHNQFSSSTSVTDTLQVTSAQRSNELSRPHTYDVRWQLRSGDVDPNPNPNPDPEPDPNRHPNPNPNPNPDPASADGRDIPLRDLGRRGGGTAGQITVWFPEHLASDDHLAGPDVVAAHPDTLPLWSADSITEPDALARFVRDRFAGELAELSEASRREVDVLLSEPEIRGAMPLLRDGVYSPVLVDADGEAVGMFKVGAVVTPRRALRTTVPGKVNLESHLAHGQKVDVAAKTTSGLALEGAVSGALTKGRPQPSATPDSDGALTGRLGASYQTSRTLGSGGSAVLQHSLRSKASHVLSEADVEYTVEFVRAHGGTRSATTGTWPGGLRLRSLRHEDAAGATPESPRFLSPELEGARALGVSATPLAV